ncbi:MAG: hypothetical protein Q8L26_08660 [Candidatus Omnitrophota bacterium]|nr:hypothetical protein [Candidatus Omnitrophota bacterium]
MPKYKKLEAWAEMSNMGSQKVKLDQIFLDPNNPRIDKPGKEKIPDVRISELAIQQDCLQQLQKQGINDLMESMKTSGFWVVDRIVLRPFGTDQFVVVEGNRRVAALRTLQSAHTKGRINIPKDIYDGIIKIEALVYHGKNPEIAWIIQGFRHTPGIKSWEKYPTARFLADFEKESKKDVREIAAIFSGMGRSEVTLSLRSFYAFEQSRSDEDYGDRLDPEKFGLFDEIIFKKPTLQIWLGWNDKKRKFKNEKNLKKFLSWTTTIEGKEPKLTVSKNTRDLLADLVIQENKKLLDDFEKEIEKEDFDIEQFHEKIFREKERKEPIDIVELIEYLKSTGKVINTLPIPQIKLANTQLGKKQKEEIIKLIENLITILNVQLKNIK